MSVADRLPTLSGRGGGLSYRVTLGLLFAGSVLAVAVAGAAFPESIWASLLDILLSRSTLSSALRLATPIVFAALGGIFAEKSGVINIGLEGLLIISAFTSVFAANLLAGDGSMTRTYLWLGFAAGVLSSAALAGLFGVVCIRYEADQIIAGLAVWLIALGLAPFASKVIYGGPSTADTNRTLGTITVPVLSEIPVFGALFDAAPTVYLMLLAVPLSWVVLNRTAFGMHIRAGGENPEALDTVGVSVSRVRYAGVLLSGVLSGVGGAALSLNLGQFVGNGQTMVNGKGFIAIVAYLFGNYNPVGAFLASMLFAGLDAVQLRLQYVQGYNVPDTLIQTIPYVTVIVVLALVGRTQIPDAAGDHYDSGEE
ncbi:MAG: ABC transporter permease [Halolamina sp.]